MTEYLVEVVISEGMVEIAYCIEAPDWITAVRKARLEAKRRLERVGFNVNSSLFGVYNPIYNAKPNRGGS